MQALSLQGRQTIITVVAYWQGSLDFSIWLQHEGPKLLFEERQYISSQESQQYNTSEVMNISPMGFLAVLYNKGIDLLVDPLI